MPKTPYSGKLKAPMARESSKPVITVAQRRFLRKLLADASYRPRRATTKRTQDVLVRKGWLCAELGGRLVPLWNPDTEKWIG